ARADGGRPLAPHDPGPAAVSDSAGGFYLGWSDLRGLPGGGKDVYVQRITAAGAISPGWPIGGLPLCTATRTPGTPRRLSAPGGGGLAGWAGRRGSRTNSTGPHRPPGPARG